MKSFQALDDGLAVAGQHRKPAPLVRMPRQRLRRLTFPAVILAVIWGVLADWRLESWLFGGPAVLLALWLLTLLPPARRWTMAPLAALRFAGWFAVQAVRGAVDVSLRAVSPRMPLNPGFRSWRTTLPEGTPRIMLANAVSLLPGTLSAEIEGQRLVIHLLDCHTDLAAEIGRLEARIAAVFNLPAGKETAA
ncbi:Na+/H+ antiporter subunit E [Paracoccus tibetensis]|uniref:Multicomponent Na+:H+ antiporter subunit E n=1 Tax=Paracoccus tibetensis TaxID=336292 RepID=A0A1G5HPE7_9RHOB|nr:Na+/H+ antiporter subunit E [Paracoccus tibetensis]SCY65742.1 multicomponent Na+:H+ antiporter subunit E [Paracoccus tibetensis]